jgi:hypothetical protein
MMEEAVPGTSAFGSLIRLFTCRHPCSGWERKGWGCGVIEKGSEKEAPHSFASLARTGG